jgi:hypothetical protein
VLYLQTTATVRRLGERTNVPLADDLLEDFETGLPEVVAEL